jgi:DNA-binding NarL/FixJ family response regulator
LSPAGSGDQSISIKQRQGEMRMGSVLICEDRRHVRDGLIRAVSSMGGVDRVEGVTSGHELLARYIRQRVTVVLIGTRRGVPAGVDAARMLVTAYPEANVIVFGGPDDPAGIAAAIAAGARGYLRWDAAKSELPPSMARTLNRALNRAGEAPAPGQARREPGAQQLTERELQVLWAMSNGMSNGQIGRELFLSEDTIKTHARRIFRKLGVKDRAEAVAHGFRHGLVH